MEKHKKKRKKVLYYVLHEIGYYLRPFPPLSTTYGKQLGNYTSLMHLIRKIDVWQSNKSLWMSSVMMIEFLEWLLLSTI